jgi:hypothetical protein
LKNQSNRATRIFLQGIAFLLASVLLPTWLPAQKASASKEKTISVRGRVLAGVNYLTGYLRGGFGDHYEVFVFGLEPRSQGDPVAPVKVMYKFFYKTEPALPDSFLDSSKLYELQLVREPSCDETVQNLSYQKNEDETGKPLPSTYILRPLDGAPKDVLKPDSVLPCYVLTPGKYKVLSQDKKPSASTAKPVGWKCRPFLSIPAVLMPASGFRAALVA